MQAFLRSIPAFLLPIATAAAAVPSFKAVDVDTKVEIGYGVTVADVNGDGKPDILLADKNLIVWYENPAWQKHVIAEKLTSLDHVCIAAMDIDGDGKCEIAVGAGWNPNDTVNSGALFYLVPPADRTQKVGTGHAAARTDGSSHPVGEESVWKIRSVSIPLHGRGNKPATGEGDGVKILALKKPADPKEPWVAEQLNNSLHKTHNFDPVQWDNDASQELLVASKEGVYLLHRVRGMVVSTQLSGTESGGAGEVRLGKLPGGRRFFATVEPMHGTNLVVYTEPPAGSDQKLWLRNVADSSLVDGHALACGDLAGTGGDQIVVGWRAMGKKDVKVGIKLFISEEKKDGTYWKETWVDENTMACEDLCLADLNGDGKLDIIAAGRGTKNLKVYFNQGVSK